MFFDQLGPPWPKHPCTDKPAWLWLDATGFRLAEDDRKEPSSPPGWQHDGWAPVAKIEWAAGRPAPNLKDRLMAAIVWSADGVSELKVLWLARQRFNWSGPVMMRRDSRSPYRVVFETFRLEGDAVRVQRLLAVLNDPRTTVATLRSRMRDMLARELGDVSDLLKAWIEHEDRFMSQAGYGSADSSGALPSTPKRGPKPLKRQRVAARMEDDIKNHRFTWDQLGSMKEVALALEYSCSRDTARKARAQLIGSDQVAHGGRRK